MSQLHCQKLDPRAVLPSRAHPGDAGLDLCSLDPVEIGPGERARVPTGIAVELPAGHAGLIVPRSGLAAKQGISIVNAPGLIDEGYRGELQVLLLNTDLSRAVTLEAGERIAQLVVIPVALLTPLEVESFSESSRGEQGFGSSGRCTSQAALMPAARQAARWASSSSSSSSGLSSASSPRAVLISQSANHELAGSSGP